jgi:hypothetical protein
VCWEGKIKSAGCASVPASFWIGTEATSSLSASRTRRRMWGSIL